MSARLSQFGRGRAAPSNEKNARSLRLLVDQAENDNQLALLFGALALSSSDVQWKHYGSGSVGKASQTKILAGLNLLKKKRKERERPKHCQATTETCRIEVGL